MHGETVWYFYSSKEVTEDEINQEDIKSENYAKEYYVGYDGHGFGVKGIHPYRLTANKETLCDRSKKQSLKVSNDAGRKADPDHENI